MITPQDKELLENKGISEEQITEQLACFEKGFPYRTATSDSNIPSIAKAIQPDFVY